MTIAKGNQSSFDILINIYVTIIIEIMKAK